MAMMSDSEGLRVLHSGALHYFEEDTWVKVQAAFYEDGTFVVTKRATGASTKLKPTTISAQLTPSTKIKGPQTAGDRAVFVLKNSSNQFELCASQEHAAFWTDVLRKWTENPRDGGPSDKNAPLNSSNKKGQSSAGLKSILKRGKQRTASKPEDPADKAIQPKDPPKSELEKQPSSDNVTSPRMVNERSGIFSSSRARHDPSPDKKVDKVKSRTGFGRTPSSSSEPKKEKSRGFGAGAIFQKGKGNITSLVNNVSSTVRSNPSSRSLEPTRGMSPATTNKKKKGVEPDGTDAPLSVLPTFTPGSYDEPAAISDLSESESSEEKATIQLEVQKQITPSLTVTVDLEKTDSSKSGSKPKKVDSEAETKRKYIVIEILNTEKTYSNGLMVVMKSYWDPLLECHQAIGESKDQINKIFGPPNSLRMIHGMSSKLVSQLEATVQTWGPESKLGAIFMKLAPFFKLYKDYSNTYGECMQLYNETLKNNKQFAAKLDELRTNSGQHSTIPDILITPIQRLPRYSLLLQDLIKNTPESHPDFAELSEAAKSMGSAAQYLNETLRQYQKERADSEWLNQMEEKGIPLGHFLYESPSRHLLKQGLMKIQVQPIDRFGKPSKENQHFVMFNDLFVHVKKDVVFKNNELASSLYSLPLTLIWIDVVKTNQWAIVGPHETLVLPLEVGSEWGAMFKTSIDQQLAYKNKLIPSTKQQYTFAVRKGKYKYPYHQGTYNGFWSMGLRHGRGRFELGPSVWIRGHWQQGLVSGKGQAQFLSAGSYHGSWSCNVQDGRGQFKWPCGTVYLGDWSKGERHGHGKITFTDGSYYIGEWVEGRMCGQGKFEAAPGKLPRYEGSFLDGLFHGVGRLELSNGVIYTGYWHAGQRTGRGKQTFPDKSVMIGDFVNGKLHGSGRIEHPDKGFYEGAWNNGLPHGQGIRQWKDKAVYEGTWVHSFRQGQGKYKDANGLTYEGNWFQNELHGEGELKEEKQNGTYKGHFLNGFYEGKGELSVPSGAFQGHWFAGKPHKSTIWTRTQNSDANYHSGTQLVLYEGEWDKGVMQGKAAIKFSNGDHYKGGIEAGVYEGKTVLTYTNGSIATSKYKGGHKVDKGTMTSADHNTFVGSIQAESPNVLLPEKGNSLPVPPLWPVFPMIFDTDTVRERH